MWYVCACSCVCMCVWCVCMLLCVCVVCVVYVVVCVHACVWCIWMFVCVCMWCMCMSLCVYVCLWYMWHVTTCVCMRACIWEPGFVPLSIWPSRWLCHVALITVASASVQRAFSFVAKSLFSTLFHSCLNHSLKFLLNLIGFDLILLCLSLPFPKLYFTALYSCDFLAPYRLFYSSAHCQIMLVPLRANDHNVLMLWVPLYYPLEKAMAPHSRTLAWKIPWMEEPDRLQSMGSLRVRHDWATSLLLFTFLHWRRKWQPTPVFLPGESQGWGSLVGCCLWGRTESDTTEVT